MKNITRLFLLIILFLSVLKINKVQAQGFYSLSENWQLKGTIGNTTFHGDINDNKNRIWNNSPFSKYYYEHRKIMIAGQLTKKINSFLFIGGQGLYGGVGGSNDALDLYFDAKLLEGSIDLGMNVSNLLWGESIHRRWYLYGSGGLGLAGFWTIKRKISTDNIVSTKGYDNGRINYTDPTVERVIHLEIGMNYRINKRWDLNLSKSYRIVDTDKLDAHIERKIIYEEFGYFSVGLIYNFNLDFLQRFINIDFNGRYSNHADPLVKKYEKMQDRKRLQGDPFKRKGKNTRYKYRSTYKRK